MLFQSHIYALCHRGRSVGATTFSTRDLSHAAKSIAALSTTNKRCVIVENCIPRVCDTRMPADCLANISSRLEQRLLKPHGSYVIESCAFKALTHLQPGPHLVPVLGLSNDRSFSQWPSQPVRAMQPVALQTSLSSWPRASKLRKSRTEGDSLLICKQSQAL